MKSKQSDIKNEVMLFRKDLVLQQRMLEGELDHNSQLFRLKSVEK